MKKIYVILSLLFSFQTLAEKPKWIDDLSNEKECKSINICAVGDGADRDTATRAATVGISKIFDNQISSKFESKLSNENESMKEEIKQATEMALQGVEVKKVYEENGKYYALATLNKQKTSSLLKNEIEKLDEKMKTLSSDSSSSSQVDLEKAACDLHNLGQK